MSRISLINPDASPMMSQPRDLIAVDGLVADHPVGQYANRFVAGYTIRHCLGAGGYGEVWQADAPGGLEKAVKFVYGRLDDARAASEMESLNRVKEVRHPFLLSLERIEVVDGQLIIVTELAEKSLKDRFDQCKAEGMSGIPREELLVYLSDAADALDYMCEQFSLQHLDVKPENLLILAGRVKVADFGLVRQVHDHAVTMMGGLTPAYAPPESFRGQPNRHSDQYSLAIVYQEMLTGVIPFPGRTAMQLAEQHQNSPPFLSPLPPQDRETIQRALSKDPDDRFDNSRQLIDALRSAITPAQAQATRSESIQATPTPTPQNPGHDDGSSDITPNQQTLVQPACQQPARPQATLEMTSPGHPVDNVINDPSSDSAAPSDAPSDVPSDTPNDVPSDTPPSNAPVRRTPAQIATLEPIVDLSTRGVFSPCEPLPPLELDPQEDVTVLRPTLIVGVGTIASRVICQYNKCLAGRFGTLDMTPIFGSLIMDTDRESLRDLIKATSEDERIPSLGRDDVLPIPLRKPQDYRAESDGLLSWISRRWLYNIPRSLKTEGFRPLGRLALLEQASVFRKMLQKKVRQITSADTLTKARNHVTQSIDESRVRIIVVSSISGGTGGGAVIDTAQLIRQTLESNEQTDGNPPVDYDLTGILMHATPCDPNRAGLALACSCATLAELAHLDSGDGYPGDPAMRLNARPGPTFGNTYVYHMGDHLDDSALRDSVETVAQYMFLNTATRASCFFDNNRAENAETVDNADGPEDVKDTDSAKMPCRVGTFELRTIGCGQQGDLPEVASEILCGELIRRWRGTTGSGESLPTQDENPPAIADQMPSQADPASVDAMESGTSESATSDEPPLDEMPVSGLLASEAVEALPREQSFVETSRSRGQTLREMADNWCEANRFSSDGFKLEVMDCLLELMEVPLDDLQKHTASEVTRLVQDGDTPWELLDDLFGIYRNRGDGPISFDLPKPLEISILKKTPAFAEQWIHWLHELPNDKEVRVTGAIRIGEMFLRKLEMTLEGCDLHITQLGGRYRELLDEIESQKGARRRLLGMGRKSERLKTQNWEQVVEIRKEIMLVHGSQLRAGMLQEKLQQLMDELRSMTHELDILAEQFNVAELWGDVSVDSHLQSRLPDTDNQLRERLVSVLREKLPELATQLDNEFRTTYFGQDQGLADVLQKHVQTELKAAALQAARAAVFGVLEEIDVANLLLPAYASSNLGEQLVRSAREAEPRFSNCGGTSRMALVSPRGAGLSQLHDAVSKCKEHEFTIVSDVGTDIVLCNEMQQIPIEKIMCQLIGNRKDIVAAATRIHTRIDIKWRPITDA